MAARSRPPMSPSPPPMMAKPPGVVPTSSPNQIARAVIRKKAPRAAITPPTASRVTTRTAAPISSLSSSVRRSSLWLSSRTMPSSSRLIRLPKEAEPSLPSPARGMRRPTTSMDRLPPGRGGEPADEQADAGRHQEGAHRLLPRVGDDVVPNPLEAALGVLRDLVAGLLHRVLDVPRRLLGLLARRVHEALGPGRGQVGDAPGLLGHALTHPARLLAHPPRRLAHSLAHPRPVLPALHDALLSAVAVQTFTLRPAFPPQV